MMIHYNYTINTTEKQIVFLRVRSTFRYKIGSGFRDIHKIFKFFKKGIDIGTMCGYNNIA